MILNVGHAATIGARANQEDSAGLWFPPDVPGAAPDNGTVLAVLADGMGGHAGGAVASSVACSTFIQVFESAGGSLHDRLESALQIANQAISDQVVQDQRLNGMGSTIVAAFVDRDGVRWLSVGDSLLYLYRNGQLQRLNDDHSLGRLLDIQAERNQITFEEAKAHRHRNALRSALTGRQLEIVDRHHEPLHLRDGDWLLLASDGIATLEDREIAALVERNLVAEPDELANQIISAVERRAMPGQDNTTLVAIRVGDGTSTGYDSNPTRVLRSSRILAPGAEAITRPRRATGATGGHAAIPDADGGSWLRAFGLATLGLAVMLLALIGGVAVYRSLIATPDTPPPAAMTQPAAELPKEKPREPEKGAPTDKGGAGKIDSPKSDAPKPESGEGGGAPAKPAPPPDAERGGGSGSDRDKSKQGGAPRGSKKVPDTPPVEGGGSSAEPPHPPAAKPEGKPRGYSSRRQGDQPLPRYFVQGREICKGVANDVELCRCLREEMRELGPTLLIPVEAICHAAGVE